MVEVQIQKFMSPLITPVLDFNYWEPAIVSSKSSVHGTNCTWFYRVSNLPTFAKKAGLASVTSGIGLWKLQIGFGNAYVTSSCNAKNNGKPLENLRNKSLDPSRRFRKKPRKLRKHSLYTKYGNSLKRAHFPLTALASWGRPDFAQMLMTML